MAGFGQGITMSNYVLSVLVSMFAAIVVADVVIALLILRATRKEGKEIDK